MGSRTRGRAGALLLGTLIGAVGLPLLATPAGAIDTRKATTATIATNVANPVVGQPVTLTAEVHATPPETGSPGASVQFVDGGGSGPVLGTIAMSGGVAQLNTSALSIGTHNVISRFAGGTVYQPSDSAPVTVTVGKANSTLTLTSNASPAAYKQAITFTATVAAVAPGSGGGAATTSFYDNGVLLGTAAMSGGVATFTTTAVAQTLGTHPITASFPGGTNLNPSSGALAQVVGKAPTTTTLAANPTAAVSGQSVTLTATVAAAPPGSGTPAATVTFKDGTTTLGTASTVNGVATFVTTALQPGAHSLTASFPGGTYFNASTSAPATVNVGPAATTTALTSSANPSTPGQAVTFTATVTPVAPAAGIPASTVTFRDGATILGTVALTGGSASITTSALSTTDHNITATYNGGSKYSPSSSATLVQSVIAVPLDTTPPTLSLSHVTSAGIWNRSAPVVVSYVASDTGSGLAGLPVCEVNFEATAAVGTPASGTVTVVGGSGQYVASCTIFDNAGNHTTQLDTVRVDTERPNVALVHTPTHNDWNNGPVEVQIAIGDPAPGSGIAAADCVLDGNPIAPATFTINDDGEHLVDCLVRDNAGWERAASRVVKIDSHAPTVDLQDVTDGATYYVDPNPTCAASDDVSIETDTALSVTPGAGAYEVVASCSKAIDQAGNISNAATATYTVILDDTDPTVSVSHTGNGLGWNSDNTVTVSIAVDDAAPSSGLVGGPECQLDGTPVGVVGSSSPYTIDVNGEGVHLVSCGISDNAGNTGIGEDTVRIDQTAPTATVGGPTDGAVYADESSIPAVTCNGTDALSGVETATPSLTATGGSAYTALCTVVDAAGNTGYDTISVDIDITDPTITVTHTGDQPSGYHNGPFVDVTIQANDADPSTGFPGAPSCTDNGNPLSVSGGTGSYVSSTVTVSGTGYHEISCTIYDGANRGASASDSFFIDGYAPAVYLSHTPDFDVWNNVDPVTVSVDASDYDGSGIAGDPTCIDNFSTPVPVSGFGPWELSISGDGQHYLYCTISDYAGHVGGSTDLVYLDATPPTVSVSGPTDGAVYADGAVPPASCSADDGPVGSGVLAPSPSVTDVGFGFWKVDCTATDNAGNTAFAELTYGVDAIDPTLSVTHSGDVAPGLNPGPTVTFTITADDAHPSAGLPYDAVCDDNGFPMTVSATSGASTSAVVGAHRVFEVTIYDEGTHHLTCTITDATGRTATADDTVLIDHTGPTATLTTPPLVNTSYTTGGDLLLQAIDNTGSIASVRCEDSDVEVPFTETGPGYWTWTPPEGAHSVACEVTDAIGLTGYAYADFIVDATPPVAFVTSPTDGVVYTSTSAPAVSCDAYDNWYVSSTTPALTDNGDGTWTATCSAEDFAGNTGTSLPVTYTIDDTPPTVTLTGPADGATYLSPPDVPALSCVTSDTVSGVAVDAVASTTNTSGVTWEARCSGATDGVGNVAPDVVVTYTVDAPPPDVYIVWSEGNFYGWSNADEEVYPDVYSHNGWGAGAVCYDNGEYVTAGTAFWVTAEGTHDIQCTATDTNGNHGYASATIMLDKTAPTVTVDGVVDGGTYAVGDEPTPSCTTSDALSGVLSDATVSVTDNGDGTVTVECSGAEDRAGNSGLATATYTVA